MDNEKYTRDGDPLVPVQPVGDEVYFVETDVCFGAGALLTPKTVWFGVEKITLVAALERVVTTTCVYNKKLY